MRLIEGVHHITFTTDNMDRLIAFYQRVFDAEITLDLTEDNLRHAFITVGEHTVLHPFQLPDYTLPEALPMFQRGRVDHFALNTPTEEAFRELRQRIIAEGRDDGIVIDMGIILLINFTDPDGSSHEIVWWKDDPNPDGVLRKNWIYIENY